VRDVVQAGAWVLDHIEYSGFGVITSETNSTLSGSILYTGMRYDRDTGLSHTPNREYAAATGQWLQEDPIVFGGGDTNLRRYVGNDAANAVDPPGLYEWPWSPNAVWSFKGSVFYDVADAALEPVRIVADTGRAVTQGGSLLTNWFGWTGVYEYEPHSWLFQGLFQANTQGYKGYGPGLEAGNRYTLDVIANFLKNAWNGGLWNVIESTIAASQTGDWQPVAHSVGSAVSPFRIRGGGGRRGRGLPSGNSDPNMGPTPPGGGYLTGVAKSGDPVPVKSLPVSQGGLPNVWLPQGSPLMAMATEEDDASDNPLEKQIKSLAPNLQGLPWELDADGNLVTQSQGGHRVRAHDDLPHGDLPAHTDLHGLPGGKIKVDKQGRVIPMKGGRLGERQIEILRDELGVEATGINRAVIEATKKRGGPRPRDE
jgi:RHS repeat-associated protein